MAAHFGSYDDVYRRSSSSFDQVTFNTARTEAITNVYVASGPTTRCVYTPPFWTLSLEQLDKCVILHWPAAASGGLAVIAGLAAMVGTWWGRGGGGSHGGGVTVARPGAAPDAGGGVLATVAVDTHLTIRDSGSW